MNPTISAARCLFLFALTAGAPAFAQDKPPAAPEAPKLAVSSQGKEKTLVEISVGLRHAAPAAAKCTDATCAAADHWAVEIEIVGRTPAGKPVKFTLAQQTEIEEQLRSAAAPKAKKVGETTISDATVSIRVSGQTPYTLVKQMLATLAMVGLHKIEFAVTSAGATAAEKSLPLPLPVDGGAKPVLDQPKAGLERVRVNMRVDQATGQIVRKWGNNEVPAGAEGDAKMRTSFETIMGDMVKFGLVDRSRVLIDAASDVPWQAVIEVIDIGLNAGFNGVQFMVAAAKK
jgi:biopolymer transport protein ExbD